MGVRLLRRREPEADASAGLQVASVAPDAELGHFRHGPYSMWSAVRYILILSILLWWLPTFGQMIAGYIGGRRAGGPWRGVIAALLPVAIIVGIAWGSEHGTFSGWFGAIAAIPAGLGAAVSAAIPPATPYVDFVLAYLGAFVNSLRGTLSTGSNGYLVTIVFAYIGGILADQARREASVGRGTSVGISISQPFFAPLRNPSPPSWDAHKAARFEDLRKIPVSYARVAPARGHAPKVHGAQADSGDEEGPGPHREAHREPKGKPGRKPESSAEAKPEPKGLDPHAKEIATRKWVERALRQYETAHRR